MDPRRDTRIIFELRYRTSLAPVGVPADVAGAAGCPTGAAFSAADDRPLRYLRCHFPGEAARWIISADGVPAAGFVPAGAVGACGLRRGASRPSGGSSDSHFVAPTPPKVSSARSGAETNQLNLLIVQTTLLHSSPEPRASRATLRSVTREYRSVVGSERASIARAATDGICAAHTPLRAAPPDVSRALPRETEGGVSSDPFLGPAD
jgi:hypothetical protein